MNYSSIKISSCYQSIGTFLLCMATIAHFTVTVANEAGVDLVLIQPFLLYYAKLVVVMLTSIF